MTTASTAPPEPRPAPKKYVRAVGPRLRKLLYVVFALLALLGANSGYLASITALEAITGHTYQNYFYQYMFLGHLVLGFILIVPFIVFGVVHMLNSWNRRNRRAVRVGYALFTASILVLLTGVLLTRIAGFFELKQPQTRLLVYWLHVACPLVAAWLYWLHRLAGPRIKWKVGFAYAGVVGVVVLAMVALHTQDPRKWNVAGPKDGEKYFKPSEAITSTGNFIPARTLMMDDYCLKCHQDAFKGWFHSAHHFSSFNNPAYLASVRETRQVALKRDGSVQASRWCAGCHDPVPFFSGAFDNPDFDVVKDSTSQAGITCTVCHAITNVDSTIGNADYTIEEPIHYPFAFSDNRLLQYVNNQLIKAKPSFHKKTFLKDFHKTAEFCSTCHKVNLPKDVTHYKDFLRGQNHYDPYLLSGVSGHGARSFYYPDKAKTNCSECHMPLEKSSDFGAKLFAGAKELSIHSHFFPGANTGLAWFNERPEAIAAEQKFLEGVMRVDIFGLREGGGIDGQLIAPLRPDLPKLKPGQRYLLETVIRTLKVGHLFTQGTVDSNEVWVDVSVTSGDRVIGRNGGISDDREVDPWSHFVNVFMLDREGNRIDRRNPQDIFVPLYNHQIPPGAGQVVHYELQLPADLAEPVTIEMKLQYRKFDKRYMDYVARSAKPGDNPIRGYTPGEPFHNDLPVTTLAVDRVTLPVEGVELVVETAEPKIDLWQRWNDYGIGLLLEGQGGAKGELKQAEEAFARVEELGRYDGPLNLARVYFTEGRLDEAVHALKRAADYSDPPAPPWTMNWLSGQINRQQGHLAEAEKNFRGVLEEKTQAMIDRKFDFSLDYEVINLLGQTLFDLAKQSYGAKRQAQREGYLRQAVEQFERTLRLDSENVTAHFNLQHLHAQLGDKKKAEEHREKHLRYKLDDNAGDRAVAVARQKYPAANHAAEFVVVYSLHRDGAPGPASRERTVGQNDEVTNKMADDTRPTTGGGE
ncbi:MAG TPA: multiheme c-type cytochrome [Pirellulales bacterium]|jgi:tetratricopeptide (TPR) repeat protein|nr:multiheme c-type cytochrome [Pirellulales bacterium]